MTHLPATMFLYCVLLCILLFASFYYRTNQRIIKYASKIRGPIPLPIIGSSYVLYGGTYKILETILYLVEKYQPLCKLQLGSKVMIFLSRPEDIQIVLTKSLEREEGYKYIRPVFGYGLFTRPVAEWKSHRRIIASTFSQQVLDSFIDCFNEYSKGLVEKLREHTGKGYIDVFAPLTQFTLDAVCSTIMGTKMNAMKEETPFILWMTRVAELSIIRMFNIYLWPEWIWKMTKLSKETADLDSKIQNYVKKVVESKRHKQSEENDGKKVFLDYLLKLTDKDGSWSNDELTNETRSVIIAASDATAITLSYCLVMLGMYQDVQEKIVKELDSVFGNNYRDVTIDDLPRLDYLERFIKETLRVFPVAATIGRELTSDLTIAGHTLAKGTSIAIPIFYIHRSSKYWSDPLKFDPDRFLPEEVSKRHPCCYLPFSYGPRNCIGFKYSYMLMKVVLTNILRHYKVISTQYRCISDLKVKMDIATKCDEGYPVQLEIRHL